MINTQTLSNHYEQMLNLTKPWTVSVVDLDTVNLQLTIRVGTIQGEKLPCPTCGRPCSMEDHREERAWRHLDTMQFETGIVCRTPRISCPEHGILSADVPWAGAYSRFTELAVNLVFTHNFVRRTIIKATFLWPSWQGRQDSNLVQRFWRPSCYH